MAYEELSISCSHIVGKHKYIVLRDTENILRPLKVYLKKVNIEATPGEDGAINASIKYQVSTHGKLFCIDESGIYDTCEEAMKKYKLQKDIITLKKAMEE